MQADPGTDGRVSLREAIEAANNTAGASQIYFNIADPLVNGVHTINAGAGMPAIDRSVVIDATTEPDSVDKPVVEIDGFGRNRHRGFQPECRQRRQPDSRPVDPQLCQWSGHRDQPIKQSHDRRQLHRPETGWHHGGTDGHRSVHRFGQRHQR
ncbi:MAG: hypothetical protein R3E83_06580 [Burkholderiaceae bacterium]